LIGVLSADKLDLFSASVAAAIILIGTGCLTFHEVAHAVNLLVALPIAASSGVSTGFDKSGAARAIAFAIINALKGLSVLGILGGIYIGAALLTAILTNHAAAGMFVVGLRSLSGHFNICDCALQAC
jgi:di/tricarboxylate transporter